MCVVMVEVVEVEVVEGETVVVVVVVVVDSRNVHSHMKSYSAVATTAYKLRQHV